MEDKIQNCKMFIYAIQQDTQNFLMTEFYSPRMLARVVRVLRIYFKYCIP